MIKVDEALVWRCSSIVGDLIHKWDGSRPINTLTVREVNAIIRAVLRETMRSQASH